MCHHTIRWNTGIYFILLLSTSKGIRTRIYGYVRVSSILVQFHKKYIMHRRSVARSRTKNAAATPRVQLRGLLGCSRSSGSVCASENRACGESSWDAVNSQPNSKCLIPHHFSCSRYPTILILKFRSYLVSHPALYMLVVLTPHTELHN